MQQLTPLIFPKADLILTKKKEVLYVNCLVRKKIVVLSPEEWVRQHVLHFLVNFKGYPLSRLSVEKSINYNGLTKRWDIVAYDADFKPKLLVECKQTEVNIGLDTLIQAASYQKIIQSEHILLTNGKQVLHFAINENKHNSSSIDTIVGY